MLETNTNIFPFRKEVEGFCHSRIPLPDKSEETAALRNQAIEQILKPLEHVNKAPYDCGEDPFLKAHWLTNFTTTIYVLLEIATCVASRRKNIYKSEEPNLATLYNISRTYIEKYIEENKLT